MENWVDLVESLALAGTLLITIVNLFTTSALSHSQQQSSIMSTKRSERIDKMREHSAGIISCCKYILHGLDTDDTKRELLHHGHSMISLLQFFHEYTYDVELITTTHKIMEHCLGDKIKKDELMELVDSFWWMCNVYVGADFERLKIESLGKIHTGGASEKEATSFDGLYKKFNIRKAPHIPEKATTVKVHKVDY